MHDIDCEFREESVGLKAKLELNFNLFRHLGPNDYIKTYRMLEFGKLYPCLSRVKMMDPNDYWLNESRKLHFEKLENYMVSELSIF